MNSVRWVFTVSLRFLLAAWVVAAASRGSTSTPQQRFFDWTRIQFDKQTYSERRQKLVDALRSSGGGVFLAPSRHGRSYGETFRQLDDFLYFTGLELPESILAIDADENKTALFVPPRDSRFENPSRANDFPGRPLGDDPELARVSGVSDIRPYQALRDTLSAWNRAGRLIRVNPGRPGEIPVVQTEFIRQWNGAESLVFHLQQIHPELRIRSAFTGVARLRMIKSAQEIDVIRRACDTSAGAIREAARSIRDGVDERSLEAVLEAAFKRGGGQRVAFASIIKSGPNSLWPWRILAAHYDRRNRKMRDGELVIFDVGTERDSYVSDVGRTFPVSGRFTDLQRQTLKTVTAVADAIIAAIKPGITLGELTRIAQQKIPPPHRKYMQTGSYYGHHIGLSTGDPALMDAPLEPGMVFTVEPWYYNHDDEIAVFIEDDVVVTENGVDVLTDGLPRSPEALEDMVGKEE